MAITLIQSKTGFQTSGGLSTTSTAAFAATTTVGNAIIVGLTNDSVTAVTSVSDTAGNTYSKVIGQLVNTEVAIWVAYNISSAASVVVSFVCGSNDGTIWAQEWAGLSTTSAADQTAVNTASTAGAITIGTTSTTTVANELVFAIASVDVAPGWGFTVGSGYSNFSQLTTSFIGAAIETAVISSIGAQSPGITLANPNLMTWRSAVATFKQAPTAIPAHNLSLMGIGA